MERLVFAYLRAVVQRAELYERLDFRPAEADFAGAGDGGDERWFEFATEAAHACEAEFKGGCHFLAGHVAGSEDEFADRVLLEGASFEEVVTDAFVCRQQYPIVRAHFRQPSFVWGSRTKVIKVALEADSKAPQSVQNCPGIAEIFVEIKDEVFRRRRGGGARAPTGWLLRSAVACSHILRPIR